jgi:hypothetical protein
MSDKQPMPNSDGLIKQLGAGRSGRGVAGAGI